MHWCTEKATRLKGRSLSSPNQTSLQGAAHQLKHRVKTPTVIPTIDLMHPTLVSTPFHREGWIYEEKYDGWRNIVHKRGAQASLVSRVGRDHTKRFPTLMSAIASLSPTNLILDGEVCIFDQQ